MDRETVIFLTGALAGIALVLTLWIVWAGFDD